MSAHPLPSQLQFPAPDQLLWICPTCGPAAHSRIEPSQVFRRNSTLGLRAGGTGSSEWRKIECTGCQQRFMLRINSEGWVNALPISTTAPTKGPAAGYSAVDESTRDWITA